MNQSGILDFTDCETCGSAGSVEHGMCQVCLTLRVSGSISYLDPPASFGETPATLLSAG